MALYWVNICSRILLIGRTRIRQGRGLASLTAEPTTANTLAVALPIGVAGTNLLFELQVSDASRSTTTMTTLTKISAAPATQVWTTLGWRGNAFLHPLLRPDLQYTFFDETAHVIRASSPPFSFLYHLSQARVDDIVLRLNQTKGPTVDTLDAVLDYFDARTAPGNGVIVPVCESISSLVFREESLWKTKCLLFWRELFGVC